MNVSSLRVTRLQDWAFKRCDLAADWAPVELPHSPFAARPDGPHHWQGRCLYRRPVRAVEPDRFARYTLYFHGAMRDATVRIDGEVVALHTGGYLPFEVDVTHWLRDGREYLVTVELDNRDNPDVPPGKPLAELDFCWYGGLYRGVELRAYPAIAITDAATAGEVAGGGIFVRTISADRAQAQLAVRVQVRHWGASPQAASLTVEARHQTTGAVVAEAQAPAIQLLPAQSHSFDLALQVARPALWNLADPQLHVLEVCVRDARGQVLDERREAFGIRHLAVSRSGGLQLNGERIRPRGTNRHQDHPWVGYALPAAAQWRDARRIKDAGFDYVRLSHYPQSPHFLAACDALGILVTNCIPGWQFMGSEAFREACYAQARQLIRRDRNHPCVAFWELSLNETAMDAPFMERLHAIGHEEFPGDQMLTAGWIDHAYDVFLHARQHERVHSWRNGDQPMVVSEYGDWEFYAHNEGFDQKSGAGLRDPQTNSRAFLGDGEAKLQRQAENHARALDDLLGSEALTDGQWSMFDYPRGYEPLPAACGVMDVFRRPKFSWHFYRSQRGVAEAGAAVFIASHWLPGSALRLPVFTNGDVVELYLNGQLVGRQTPDRATFPHLPHPPVYFELPQFESGTLEAVALVDGKPVARHTVATPGEPARLSLTIDWADTQSPADAPDLLFVHVEILDAHGQRCVQCSDAILLTTAGDYALTGDTCVRAQAGVASFLIRKRAGGAHGRLRARHEHLGEVSRELEPAEPAAPL